MASIASEIGVEIADTTGGHVSRQEPRPERILSAWIQLAAILGFLAIAAPFFVGRVYVADDLGEFHLPLRNFYSEQLARGEPFDWMNSLFGGFYLTGEGQLGAYHPLHQALYRLLPLGAAFDLELLASYPLLFAGMFLFLRRWIVRNDASLFGALAFTFCGFNLLHFVHPNAVAIIAHIPWLLFAVEVAVTDQNPRRRTVAELAVGLLTASELLIGYPQYAWFSLVTVTAYAAWRAMALRIKWQSVAVLLLSTALGVMTAAVQLLPTMDALADSVRNAPDAEFANAGSLHPLNVVQLVAPYLFQTRVVGQNTHELGLYAGAVPLLLCVWLLTQRQRWGRLAPLTLASLVFGGVALLMAMGEFGGLYHWQSFLPVVNRFRFPCRAIVLVHLSLAVLTAVAVSVLSQHRKADNPIASTRPLVVIVILSIALAIAEPLVWGEFVADWPLIWIGPLLFSAAATLIALAQRGVRWSFAAMAIFTVSDLCCYGMSYSVYGRTADLREYVAQIPLPPHDASSRIAVHQRDGLRTGDRMLLAGLKRLDGYAGLEPARQLDYATHPAMQVAGVGWFYQPPAANSETMAQWTRVTPTAPRIRLVTHSLSDKESHNDAPTLDVVTTDEQLDLPVGPAGNAELFVDRPGQFTIDTVTTTRQLLVTTESFHSGWEARVDGRKQRVMRINRDFLGCVVEPGGHRVELVFRPQSLRVGKIISSCGLGLMVWVFWLRNRNRGQRHQPGPLTC